MKTANKIMVLRHKEWNKVIIYVNESYLDHVNHFINMMRCFNLLGHFTAFRANRLEILDIQISSF